MKMIPILFAIFCLFFACTPRVEKLSTESAYRIQDMTTGGGEFLVDSLRFSKEFSLCPQSGSGVLLRFGIDRNGNSILEENEVINTTFVCDGQNAILPIIKVTDITDSSICHSGSGILIEVGYDHNSNNILDPDEVISSKPICDGRDGSDGFNSLVKTTRITISTEICLSGSGVLLSSGLDINRNSILDENEITREEFVCDGKNGVTGTDGLNSLIKTRRVLISGDICSSESGVVIESGLDLNRNGSLDANEITSEIFVCDGASGKDGTNGINGLNSIITAVPSDIDKNICPSEKGIIIKIGLDINNNSILDASEIQSQTFMCHGEKGDPGVDGLLPVFSTEPAQCIDGEGILIKFGYDLNRNNSLDPDEIIITETFCGCSGCGTGTSGYNSLIQTSRVQVSTEICKSGTGLLVLSGLDLNRNNILDPSEVRDQDYVCDGISGSGFSSCPPGTYFIKIINACGFCPAGKTYESSTQSCKKPKDLLQCGTTIFDSCIIFKDSFERSNLVTSNNFPWQRLAKVDEWGATSVEAKIENSSHLGPIYDGQKAVLFSGRAGSSAHEIYLISALLNVRKFDEVMIFFKYIPLSLESSMKLPFTKEIVPESIRVDVCNDTNNACGVMNGEIDRLIQKSKWDRYWIEPFKFGTNLNIRNYTIKDWESAIVVIDLNNYKNKQDDFVFKISAALTDGYKSNNRNNLMDDGIIFDDVVVIGIVK